MYLETREKFADLINHYKFKVGCEIGVRQGRFSDCLLCKSNIEKWYAIDAWWLSPIEGSQQSDKADAERLLSKYPHCQIVQKTSVEASKDFKDGEVDFVYIDAAHTYDYVKEDISVWYPKISSGGILSGHDYDPKEWPGVVDAVEEFVKANNLRLFITGIGSRWQSEGDCNRASWWFIKP